MILASIRMRPKEEKMDSVLRTLHRLLEPMRVQPGCLGFRCSRDIEDKGVMVLEERWEAQEDMERHVQSDTFQTILSLLEESCEQPVVEFLDVTDSGGMERIAELRG